MQLAPNACRQKLHMLLDELPDVEVREVYYFTIFLHQQVRTEAPSAEVPSMPAEHLRSLAGLTAVGGDALRDAEIFYE